MTNIQCTRCGQIKDISEFYVYGGRLNGRRCKVCRRQMEHDKRWTPAKLEKQREFRLKGTSDEACQVIDCDQFQSHGGLCSRHYRQHRQGLLDPALIVRVVRVCGFDSCWIEINKNKVLCRGHEKQLQRTGECWPLGTCRSCHGELPQEVKGRRLYCEVCVYHPSKRHGKDLVWFDNQLEAQGHRCAICGSPDPETRSGWAIDHDHGCCDGPKSCGKCVRGLLCNNCNAGLGFFSDNADRLVRAVEYIKFHQIRMNTAEAAQ